MNVLIFDRDQRLGPRVVEWLDHFEVESHIERDPDQAYRAASSAHVLLASARERAFLSSALEQNRTLAAHVWSDRPLAEDLPLLREHPRIASVIGLFGEQPRRWELEMLAVRSMKPGAGEVWLPWRQAKNSLAHHRVRGASSLESTSIGVETALRGLGVPPWVRLSIEDVVHELLMNALHDAPRSVSADVPPNRQEASLELFANEEFISVEVADRFGRLSRGDVIDHLLRGLVDRALSRTSNGAGLGLTLCHRATTALIFNVVDSQCTRAIGVFERTMSRPEFRSCARSLHYFHQPPSRDILSV